MSKTKKKHHLTMININLELPEFLSVWGIPPYDVTFTVSVTVLLREECSTDRKDWSASISFIQ